MQITEPSKKKRRTIRPARLGRLTVRPQAPTKAVSVQPGLSRLALASLRDGYIYAPGTYNAERPAALVVLLHGAGGDARAILPLFMRWAEAKDFLILAPDARGRTWDLIEHTFGPDVDFLDHALTRVFERYNVDPGRIAIAGFSDGATYALTLGMANGDIFRQVMAFSPGFTAPLSQQGAPRLYVAHGTRDEVLPIGRCSRRFVPRLVRAGYDVRYREFVGGHELPEAVVEDALRWREEGRNLAATN